MVQHQVSGSPGETGSVQTMKSATILIVEDEAIVAKSIEKHLVSQGYSVAGSVATGPDALALAARVRPDLILLDIRLKGTMDGIEVARIIRDWFSIPVLFITAFADTATIARANDTGPCGYLIKPFGMKDLLSTIAVTLSRIEQEKADAVRSIPMDARSSGVLDNAPVAMAAIDPDKKIILVNAAFETLTGYSRRDVAGVAGLSSLIGTEDLENVSGYQRIFPVDPGVTSADITVRLKTRSSGEIPVTLRLGRVGETALTVISFLTGPSGS